jgi:hypothetical protein
MALEVEDIEATVEKLRGRGVVFEEYDFRPHDREGNRRDRGELFEQGRGRRGAWFRDSEGNVLGIGQPFT